MKYLVAAIFVALSVNFVSAQSSKAPPVTIDDRVTSLEARVKSLEEAYLTKKAATKTETAKSETKAANQSPFGPDYEWKYLDNVGYGWVHKSVKVTGTALQPSEAISIPAFNAVPQNRYQLWNRLPTINGTCGPNGCGISVTR